MGTFERHRYPASWEQMALACKEQAGWQCQHCGAMRDEKRIGLVSGKEYTVVIAACHENHDPENPEAVLIACCQACHMKMDAMQHARTRMRKHWQMVEIQQRGAGQLLMPLVEASK